MLSRRQPEMAKLHAVRAAAAAVVAVAAAAASECDLSASWVEVPAVVGKCQSIMIKTLLRSVWTHNVVGTEQSNPK